MSYAGRITYNSINVDFERAWNAFTFSKNQNRAVVPSASGIKEYLNFYDQDFIQAVKNKLTAQEKMELLQWFEYVKDGSSFSFERDRGLGAYYGFEKTLNNNDETALTFTRTYVANSASYIDPSTGFLSFAGAADIARYPAGKYGHGLLIEGSRANIISNQGMDHADWVKTNFTVSDNDTTEILDPAGGNNADKITAGANSATAILTSSVAVGTDDGAFSVWIACPTGTVEGEIIIDDASITNTTTQTFTATPEWQKIEVIYNNIGDPSDWWKLTIQIDTSGDILYIYGPQLEVGAGVLFASNFILTAGAAVTRNAEKALGLCANVIGRRKGTIGFWFKPEYGTGIGTTRMLWHSGADGTNRHISIVINASNNWEIHYHRSNGISYVGTIAGSASQIAQDTWIHLVLTYDSTISNGLNWYINGDLVSTSTNDAGDASAIGTNFAIGSFIAGGSEAFGIFDDIIIRKDVLNASQIKRIYNQGKGLGEIRNRWTSVALTNPEFIEEMLQGINRYNFQIEMEEILS